MSRLKNPRSITYRRHTHTYTHLHTPSPPPTLLFPSLPLFIFNQRSYRHIYIYLIINNPVFEIVCIRQTVPLRISYWLHSNSIFFKESVLWASFLPNVKRLVSHAPHPHPQIHQTTPSGKAWSSSLEIERAFFAYAKKTKNTFLSHRGVCAFLPTSERERI